MPKNGYWIECIPITSDRKSELAGIEEQEPDSMEYTASLPTIPDIKVIAKSPDQAIDRLRRKLKALKRYYQMTGKELPEKDSPITPPRQKSGCRNGGWISVYVHVGDTSNHP